MSLALSTLAVLSIAADPTVDPPRLAAVNPAGAVLVSADEGSTWHAVHHCEAQGELQTGTASGFSDACESSPAPAAMAWVQGSLYLACSGDAVFRWNAGASAAQPAGLAALPGVAALGARGDELLVAGDDASIWSYRPGQTTEYVTEAPEPVLAIAASGAHIAVAGATAVWRWTSTEPGRHWAPLATTQACALAATPAPGGDAVLWLAGAHGLIALSHGGSSVRLIAPILGVAIAGDVVLAADGHSVFAAGAASPDPTPPGADPAHDRAFTAPAPPRGTPPVRLALQGPLDSAVRPDGPDWDDLSRRARRARWIPRLTAGLSYRRSYHGANDSNQGNRALEIWLLLTWPFMNKEVIP